MTVDTDADTAVELKPTPTAPVVVVDDAEPAEHGEDHLETPDGSRRPIAKRRWWRRMPTHRAALLVGLTVTLILTGLAGWLGWQLNQTHHIDQSRAAYLQAGRQGALNLTTVDWQHADEDVQRILSAATGTFYDDFSKRSQPFIDVLKQAQSTSQGTITAAGLESVSDTGAQVLVAVSVKTTNAGAPEQQPRSWRMRISVQEVGNDVKVSNVEFVP